MKTKKYQGSLGIEYACDPQRYSKKSRFHLVYVLMFFCVKKIINNRLLEQPTVVTFAFFYKCQINHFPMADFAVEEGSFYFFDRAGYEKATRSRFHFD